jgi:hypothetical protein
MLNFLEIGGWWLVFSGIDICDPKKYYKQI